MAFDRVGSGVSSDIDEGTGGEDWFEDEGLEIISHPTLTFCLKRRETCNSL